MSEYALRRLNKRCFSNSKRELFCTFVANDTRRGVACEIKLSRVLGVDTVNLSAISFNKLASFSRRSSSSEIFVILGIISQRMAEPELDANFEEQASSSFLHDAINREGDGIQPKFGISSEELESDLASVRGLVPKSTPVGGTGWSAELGKTRGDFSVGSIQELPAARIWDKVTSGHKHIML